MDKFQSSWSLYANKIDSYKVACSQCNQLYIKANDEPFICLTCGAMDDDRQPINIDVIE